MNYELMFQTHDRLFHVETYGTSGKVWETHIPRQVQISFFGLLAGRNYNER